MTEHTPPRMTSSVSQVPTHWHFWPTASLREPHHCPRGIGMPWHTRDVLQRSLPLSYSHEGGGGEPPSWQRGPVPPAPQHRRLAPVHDPTLEKFNTALFIVIFITCPHHHQLSPLHGCLPHMER